MNKGIYINIFIHPPDDIVEDLLQLTAIADRFSGEESSYGKSVGYHVGTYYSFYPVKNEAEIIKAFESIDFEAFDVVFGNLTVQQDGFVYLQCLEGHQEITNLHYRYIKQLNDLREGYLREKYMGDLGEYSEEQVDCIRKYGSPRFGELFDPHITIGNVDAENVDKATTKFEKWKDREISFRVSELVLTKSKEYETYRDGDVLEVAKKANEQKKNERFK